MLGGYKQAFVFAHEHKTMTTGCVSYDQAPEMGIGKPGIKVCPIDVPSATIEIEFGDHVEGFQKGLQFEFEPLLDSEGPLVLSGTANDFSGNVRPQFEADRTYTLKFLHSAPPAQITSLLSEADAGTGYRLSVCIGADTTVRTDVGRRFSKTDNGPRSVYDFEHSYEVFSFEELNGNLTHDTYFRDGEWIHLKFNEDKVNDKVLLDKH